MYETRQNKEKVSRRIDEGGKKNIHTQKNTIKNKVSPRIIQCNTEDDPFVYGYKFKLKHLSDKTGDELKAESLQNKNLTLINENSLTNQLNNKNFNFTNRTVGEWQFAVTVHDMEAYYSDHSHGAILLGEVMLKGYFQDNHDNLIAHLEY